MTDCLVLCITELTKNTYKMLAKTFVLYDVRNEQFYLYGKRNDTYSLTYEPYTFTCESIPDLASFIKYTLNVNSDSIHVTYLYNYSDLPECIRDVNYDLLNKTQENRLIVSKNYDCLKIKTIKKILGFLNSVYNEY
jgi:hypothetical protein